MAACSRICVKYKAKKMKNESRYATGQKCCSHCGIFINYAGYFCPCCSTKLRTRPRTKSQKEKFREALNDELIVQV